MRVRVRLVVAIVLAVLVLYGHDRVKAQSGQVVFLGATAGTTLAANCPTTPATPSVCVVGGGVYAWQTAAQGWFLLAPPTAAVAGVSGIIVCNAAGTSCTAAQTNTVTLDIPKTATTTVTVAAPTATATTTVN